MLRALFLSCFLLGTVFASAEEPTKPPEPIAKRLLVCCFDAAESVAPDDPETP